MRSLSGTRNRVVLVLAGVLALVAAAWLLAVSFGVALPGHSEPVVDLAADSTIAEFAQAQRDWLLPTAAAVAVLAALIGLLLLIGQIPSRPSSSTLRFHGDGTLLGTVEPRVLERALADRLDQVAGIEESTLDVSGSTEALCVQGTVTAAADSEAEWSVGEARRRLAEDVETATGMAPQRIDLLVALRSGRSTSGASSRVDIKSSGADGRVADRERTRDDAPHAT